MKITYKLSVTQLQQLM